MRSKLAYLLIILMILTPSLVLASEPIISSNVTVSQGQAAAQCSSSWEGSVNGSDIEVVDSGDGENTMLTSPVVRSCVGCNYDSKSGNCVCKTCYDHYDN